MPLTQSPKKSRRGAGKTSRSVYGKAEDRYLELVRLFPLRPLRDDADLDAAVAVIDMLLDQGKRSRAEEDYLDVLGDLVYVYEEATIPMGPVSDDRMLRHLIEARRVTQAQAAREAGIAESTISEVLSGKRKLNRNQIAKLSKYFHVDPGVFAPEG